MTTPQTLIFDALDAYIADITAALPDIQVVDGPQVIWPTEQDFIIVGANDILSDGMVDAVLNGSQDWASLGAGERKETFTIASVYVAWTGDTGLTALADCRARANASITAISSSLRTPPVGTGDAMLTNTLNIGRGGWCGMYISGIQQIQQATVEDENGSITPGGAVVHVPFYLDCVAYI